MTRNANNPIEATVGEVKMPILMCVVRSNLDDVPIAIGPEAQAAFASFKRCRKEESLERKAMAAARKVVKKGKWPVWDESGFCNVLLLRWTGPREFLVLDQFSGPERKVATA